MICKNAKKDFNPKLYIIIVFTVFLTAVMVCASFDISHAAGAAFNPKPLFEVEIGDKSPRMLGEDTDESKILNYDKFYYPAAMITCEQENKIFVLDSIKNRICAFSLDGRLVYELKLPFEHHPIDMAYFKDFKRFFIVFQQAAAVGVVDIKENASDALITAHKLLSVKEVKGLEKIEEINIQNIWPCNLLDKDKNTFLLNAFFSDYKNIILTYNNGSLSGAKTEFKIEDYALAAVSDASIMSLMTDTRETRLVREKLATGEPDWHVLLKELTLGKPGFNCRNLRIIGGDSAGNSYVEAHYGFGEDQIQKTFVYKFNSNGRFKGRTEIFHSPEMLTNHFVTVDLSGSVFYMKKNEKTNKIQFYKFVIDELN
jgi:hypothetical protein